MDPFLYELSHKFLRACKQTYRRYFIQKNRLKERLAILAGQRGMGKTTLLTQYLLGHVQGDLFSPKILYVPADHLSVESLSLYAIAEQFAQNGGEYIAFDEIHKRDDWSLMLKSIYDSFPTLKILASGSSALEIHRGSHDLSRRAILYRVAGLSFREFLEMRFHLELPAIQLNDMLENHPKYAYDLIAIIEKEEKILPLFQEYLEHGFYPYWFEWNDIAKFQITLEQGIHVTLEADLLAIHPHLSGTSIKKIRALLTFIAENAPYTPSWSQLSSLLEVGDERTLKNYFSLLEKADLISLLYKSSKKLSAMDTPAKIYLHNPNLCYTIARGKENIGTVRETFLFNILSQSHTVTIPMNGDFLVDDHILLEVGGKNKNRKQIWTEQEAYVVADDLEIGAGRKLPLWLFGFLY